MRLLVTGASGLLGVNLALETSSSHTVFGVVVNHPLKTEEFTVIQQDLLEEDAVENLLDRTKPNWVVHCAALANLEECEANPKLAYDVNVGVTEKLAKHVARSGARLIYVSTDSVFDGREGGYSEDDSPNPLSYYSQTKLLGEQVVQRHCEDALILRINIFGWSIEGSKSLAEFFMNRLANNQQADGFTDIKFCPLLVNDLAKLILEMIEANLKGIYHLGSSECVSKYEFGVRLANRFGYDERLISPTTVSDSDLTAPRSTNLTMSTTKIATALNTRMQDIDSGIDGLYELHQAGYPEKLRRLI